MTKDVTAFTSYEYDAWTDYEEAQFTYDGSISYEYDDDGNRLLGNEILR